MAEWTPERQAVVFRGAYLASRRVEPSMGGRFVGGFHEIVVATAKAQGVDPEALFRRHLATWLKEKVTAKARTAPYAFFAQAWGELADCGPEPAKERTEALPAKVVAEAMAGRRAELLSRLGVLEGDLALARVNGRDEGPILAEMAQVKGELRQLRGAA